VDRLAASYPFAADDRDRTFCQPVEKKIQADLLTGATFFARKTTNFWPISAE
jgi:hypothetical protein